MIIVPTDTPGFELVRNIPVMGDAGEGWTSHAEVRLRRRARARGEPPRRRGRRASLIAQERLGPGRIHHCMRWIGICERAFDLMCRARRRARARAGQAARRPSRSCRRGSPRAAPRSTPRACWCCTPRGRSTREGAAAARDEVSLIKFYVAGVLQRVLDRAIQVHGALGITDDTPLAFWYAPRARRAHLRRPRRGPQDGRWPGASSRGYGVTSERGLSGCAMPGRLSPGRARRRGARRRRSSAAYLARARSGARRGRSPSSSSPAGTRT